MLETRLTILYSRVPRDNVMKLCECLRNEEFVASLWFCRPKSGLTYLYESSEVGYRRKMCAHAHILALEEAIDTEWVYVG